MTVLVSFDEGVLGGRVFFSDAGRSLIEEDEIELTSVGVNIGSSMSHLLFSTIVLERMGMADGQRLSLWTGSASYVRLAATACGIVAGLAPVLNHGHPLVLVADGDIGGLLGIQCRTGENVPEAIVSIDGIELSEFDFIDIWHVIRSTGAAPMVLKILLFPTS